MGVGSLKSIKKIAIIGGGPAGMMAAEHLAAKGLDVTLFEGKPAVLRKFLVAGKGGLNLTRSEDFQVFLSRYGDRASNFEPFLRKFGPEQVQTWADNLGSSTFVGSSGKIFPREFQSVSLRRKWIERLIKLGVRFQVNHRWIGWNEQQDLLFHTKEGVITFHADAVVLALGGASWPTTGSDGSWIPILKNKVIEIKPFIPANCGFNVNWSNHFRDRFQGVPVKTVFLQTKFEGQAPNHRRGEFIITKHGLEGSLIYFFAASIRNEIERNQRATIFLDLAPDWSTQKLESRLSQPRGSRSLSSHLKKSIGIEGVKAGLLWEFVSRTEIGDPVSLAKAIKSLPIPLLSPRPIEEAISSAGGVRFSELDDQLMIRKLPGVFCAGEMLDWEAPTGGYLLTGCFSTGMAAADGVIRWISQPS